MELRKIDESFYTVDEKYFLPNDYELKCRLASKTNLDVFDVDSAFLTDLVTEAEYEFESDLVRIAFPVNDVITEIFIDSSTGEVKVCFDYLPIEIEEIIKSEVVKILNNILKPSKATCCDSCRYKHQYKITGVCGEYYWVK